jgi:hypothetical protein
MIWIDASSHPAQMISVQLGRRRTIDLFPEPSMRIARNGYSDSEPTIAGLADVAFP